MTERTITLVSHPGSCGLDVDNGTEQWGELTAWP